MAKQPTQGTLDKAAKNVTPADLDDLAQIEQEFEGRIEQYYTDGRTYMMQQFVMLLAKIKAEKKKMAARFDREGLASHRNALAALKKGQRGAQDDGESSEE